jgi:signal transduction histidine kinase
MTHPLPKGLDLRLLSREHILSVLARGIGRMKRFMDESHRLSLIISTSIILIVQVISLAILSHFAAKDMNRNVSSTADEIGVALVDPLFNVNDLQAARIGEALLSSGRIAGITIESTVSGRVLDKRVEQVSRWIRPQYRHIQYEGIDLGSVVLYFSDRGLRDIVLSVLLIMLILIAAVLAANYLAHRLVSRKRIERLLGRLTSGLDEIAAGRHDREIEETGYSDMDAIIGSMNDMARKVREKSDELVAANSLLERRVSERTVELKEALVEQRLLQDRLIQSGKLSALGQVSAGIAHELNTPLGAIISANRTVTEFFDGALPGLLPFIDSLDPAERSLFDEVARLGFQENRTLAAALPSRSLSREILGRLEEAGIADAAELVAKLMDLGLHGRVQELVPLLTTRRNIEIVSNAGETVIARRMVQIIEESSQRSASVVSAFRSYLSPEAGEEDRVVDAAEDIRRTLALMHSVLKHGIEVRASLAPAPIRGSSEKYMLVWMNLLRNAAQAMEYRGILEVCTERRGEAVVVSVIDHGPGIPADLRGRIFEPFFTTKGPGEGMGIGLDICRRIVGSYRGTISFESRPGRTEFSVCLPAEPESVAAPVPLNSSISGDGR